MDDCSFGVTGLRLQGAQCTNNKLSLAATIVNELPLTKLQWIRVNPADMYKKSLGKVSESFNEFVLYYYYYYYSEFVLLWVWFVHIERGVCDF